jgi:uncharacterized protein YneF (UPF0154 family)
MSTPIYQPYVLTDIVSEISSVRVFFGDSKQIFFFATKYYVNDYDDQQPLSIDNIKLFLIKNGEKQRKNELRATSEIV